MNMNTKKFAFLLLALFLAPVVADAQGNEKPYKYFTMHYQTLEDEKGYWLDKCEFILNTK